MRIFRRRKGKEKNYMIVISKIITKNIAEDIIYSWVKRNFS